VLAVKYTTIVSLAGLKCNKGMDNRGEEEEDRGEIRRR
jgi:hypothetical protein